MRWLQILGILWLTANPLAELDPVAPPEGNEATALFADSTESVLVEVPVEVLRGGEPQRGLGLDDFLLYDNGLLQQIVAVDETDLDTVESPGPELAVAARRHFLLLFDVSFNSSAGLARAQQVALDLVEKELHPTDLVAVATVGLRDGAQLILGFSPDHAQARMTIASLGRSRSANWRPDPLQLFLQEPDLAREPTASFADPARAEEGVAIFQHLLDRQADQRGRREVQKYTESLTVLANLLRAARGHKQVLLFSEGFEGRLLADAATSERRQAAQQALEAGKIELVDSDHYFGSRQVVDYLSGLTEELRRADCTLHSIDLSGHSGQEREGLVTLARDTGGEVVRTSGPTANQLAGVMRRGRHGYLLTYRPTDLELDGSYRKIRVKVREAERGVKIAHRPGYFASGIPTEGPAARLALADQMLDRRGGEIKTTVHALISNESVGGRSHVPVVVEVKGPSFLGGVDPGRLESLPVSANPGFVDAEVFVYALGQDGVIADYFSQGISFDLQSHGPHLRKHGFKLFAPLLLPTGRFTLRALVRNADQNLLGLATSSLAVPAAKGRNPRPPQHLIDPEWLLVRAERRDLARFPSLRDSLDLLAEILESQKTPTSSPAPEPPSKLPDQYREALELFAAGPTGQGLEELERFEAAQGTDPSRVERLGRIEFETIKLLGAETGSDALWPVLLAHHDLFFLHRGNKRPYLEIHSREMVQDVAELALHLGDDTLQIAAGQALASLGCSLVAEGRSAGFELIEQSLELDPANEAAHLCMASYFEKFGGPYENAVEWLEQLVARHPESREARLRLAINVMRLADLGAEGARRRTGFDLLEDLLRENRADWITSIAAQELSRRLLQSRDLDRALEVLENARAFHPADQELLVQLSFLYDRLGRTKDSQEAVTQIRGGSTTAGARGRYNNWTSDALSASRRELKAGAQSRLNALQAALGANGSAVMGN